MPPKVRQGPNKGCGGPAPQPVRKHGQPNINPIPTPVNTRSEARAAQTVGKTRLQLEEDEDQRLCSRAGMKPGRSRMGNRRSYFQKGSSLTDKQQGDPPWRTATVLNTWWWENQRQTSKSRAQPWVGWGHPPPHSNTLDRPRGSHRGSSRSRNKGNPRIRTSKKAAAYSRP